MEGSGEYWYHIQSKSVTNPFCFRYSMPRFGFMLNLKWGESSRLMRSAIPCYDLRVDSSKLSGLLVDADLKFDFPLLLLLKAAQSRCDLPKTTSEPSQVPKIFVRSWEKIVYEQIWILNRLTPLWMFKVCQPCRDCSSCRRCNITCIILRHPRLSRAHGCHAHIILKQFCLQVKIHSPTSTSLSPAGVFSSAGWPRIAIGFWSWKVHQLREICCPVDILLYLGPSSVILLALCCFFAWFADDGYRVIVIWSPEIRHWDSHPIDNGSHECHLNQGWVPELETSWNFRLWNVVASFERSAKDCRASCFNSCSSRYIKLQTACLKCLNC